MFEEIYGNEINKEILAKSVEEKKFSHAYLFAGPKGTQKMKTALEFAMSMFCREETDKPCRKCSQCIKIIKGNHPDVHIIETLEDATSIKISQIRGMQKNISLKPYEGDMKLYIINQCETMGDPAQNSILKVLEEPESGTVIILVANSKSSILPTILSRCQILNFAPMPQESFIKTMKKVKNLNEEDSRFLFHLTQGKIGEALDAVENPEKQENYKMIVSIMDKIANGNFENIFNLSKFVKERKMADIAVTDYLLIYFRNKLEEILKNEACANTDYLNIEKINDIIEKIIDFQSNTKINLNMSLQIENLLLRIQEE
ncbi:DNA polymerase III subunit delta' [Alkalibacter mobilis]|uniref:DNA polymerase III subunit delta' n=1 Tax=Alkalibacter mobilis TaxID=2787712 RepID=UPI00189D62B7|nr:DNA polymerase III subunit delta' [Alkalibacter mobilis]MBF7096104.1 DNA polymerase III subunit delta' [Alkalibacter mobilis]